MWIYSDCSSKEKKEYLSKLVTIYINKLMSLPKIWLLSYDVFNNYRYSKEVSLCFDWHDFRDFANSLVNLREKDDSVGIGVEFFVEVLDVCCAHWRINLIDEVDKESKINFLIHFKSLILEQFADVDVIPINAGLQPSHQNQSSLDLWTFLHLHLGEVDACHPAFVLHEESFEVLNINTVILVGNVVKEDDEILFSDLLVNVAHQIEKVDFGEFFP